MEDDSKEEKSGRELVRPDWLWKVPEIRKPLPPPIEEIISLMHCIDRDRCMFNDVYTTTLLYTRWSTVV